jgi:hypothetical protein
VKKYTDNLWEAIWLVLQGIGICCSGCLDAIGGATKFVAGSFLFSSPAPAMWPMPLFGLQFSFLFAFYGCKSHCDYG